MNQDELRRASVIFQRGHYDLLLVTGGPVSGEAHPSPVSYAERARVLMRDFGIPERSVVAVPTTASEAHHTYGSGLAVARWLDSRHLPMSAVELVSHGPHSRRSRTLYRLALGEGVEVGVIALPCSEYDLSRWWSSREGVRDVLTEAAKYAWASLFFHPEPWRRPGNAAPAVSRTG